MPTHQAFHNRLSGLLEASMTGYMQPSSYILFARRVTGSGWSKRMIWRKFDREVDREDYARSERGEILAWLYKISAASLWAEKNQTGTEK